MSVAQRTPEARAALLAAPLRDFMCTSIDDADEPDANISKRSSPALARLIAVARMPLPIGFVRTSRSPGRAAAFVRRNEGCARPVTDKPYFSSVSFIEWPPTMCAPA